MTIALKHRNFYHKTVSKSCVLASWLNSNKPKLYSNFFELEFYLNLVRNYLKAW